MKELCAPLPATPLDYSGIMAYRSHNHFCLCFHWYLNIVPLPSRVCVLLWRLLCLPSDCSAQRSGSRLSRIVRITPANTQIRSQHMYLVHDLQKCTYKLRLHTADHLVSRFSALFLRLCSTLPYVAGRHGQNTILHKKQVDTPLFAPLSRSLSHQHDLQLHSHQISLSRKLNLTSDLISIFQPDIKLNKCTMADRDILPDNFKPRHYDLVIKDLDFGNWSYKGTVT